MFVRMAVIGLLLLIAGLTGLIGNGPRLTIIGGVVLVIGGIGWFVKNGRGASTGRNRRVR